MSNELFSGQRATPARLVIADDHDLARAGLRAMLTNQEGLEVVGEAANGREALELCRRLKPDLALLDVRMPEMDGLTTCHAIKQESPTTSVILVTMHESIEYLLEALIPLTVVEGRFHRRTLELQMGSAPELFRMQYLSQKSIDATWQRDIRVHNSSILDEEYRILGKRYLGNLRRLMHRFQLIRLGVGFGVAATITLATGVVFWLVNQGTTGLAEVAILLPALYLGLSEGKAFAFSWGSLVENMGYIEQVFDFLDQSFERTEPAPSLPVTV